MGYGLCDRPGAAGMRTALPMGGPGGGQEGGVYTRLMCWDSFSPTFRSSRTRVRACNIWLVIETRRQGQLDQLWPLCTSSWH